MALTRGEAVSSPWWLLCPWVLGMVFCSRMAGARTRSLSPDPSPHSSCSAVSSETQGSGTLICDQVLFRISYLFFFPFNISEWAWMDPQSWNCTFTLFLENGLMGTRRWCRRLWWDAGAGCWWGMRGDGCGCYCRVTVAGRSFSFWCQPIDELGISFGLNSGSGMEETCLRSHLLAIYWVSINLCTLDYVGFHIIFILFCYLTLFSLPACFVAFIFHDFSLKSLSSVLELPKLLRSCLKYIF